MFPSFFPALGSSIEVPVGNAVGDSGSLALTHHASVRVSFVARLKDSELAEANSSGVRIEVWTDAPVSGQPEGQWSAVPFEREHLAEAEAQQSAYDVPLDITAGRIVDGDVDAGKNGQPTGEHVFRASFLVPQVSGKHYSFTYRLVYPSGIQWLGTDHSNGTLELAAGDGFFQESGSWMALEGVRTVQILDPDGADVRIGQLRTDSWRWSGWAVDDFGVNAFSLLSAAETIKGRFIYLIPEPVTDSNILAPHAIVLRVTSRTSSISIDTHGQVSLYASNATSLIFNALDVSMDNSAWLRRALVASWATSNIFDVSPVAAIFASVDSTQTTANVYVMPLTKSTLRLTSIPASAFNCLSTPSSSHCAFITGEKQVAVFDTSEGGGVQYVNLASRSYGGSFIACATYGLHVDQSPKWLLASPSLVTPPTFVSRPFDAHNALPTPPESPRTRTRHSVSFRLPGDDEDNVSAPTSTGTPPDESSPGNDASQYGHRGLSTVDAVARRMGNLHPLARLRTLLGNGDVSRELFSTFSAFTWVFTNFMRYLFLTMFYTLPNPGLQVSQPVTEEENSATPSSPSDPQSLEDSAEAKVDGATQPVSAPSSLSSDETSSTSTPSSDISTNKGSPSTPGSETASLSASPVSVGASRRHISFNFLEWDIPVDSESITLIAKHADGGKTNTESLLIQIDGQTVKPQVTEHIGDGATVLEISRTAGAMSKLLVGLRS